MRATTNNVMTNRPVKRIHQIFFRFDGRRLQDYPVFVQSRRAFESMQGWRYKLWREAGVARLCRNHYPQLWNLYKTLPYDIQRVDLAKYMIVDWYGGAFSDLDIIPRCSLDQIVGAEPYVFDRCSRKHVIANDFFYAGQRHRLPGIFAYFEENLKRIDAIPAYKQRRFRYVCHTTGPDFFTRYLKRAGLAEYLTALSNRFFLDPEQRHRHVRARDPKIDVYHHVSWASQLSDR